MKTVSGVNPRTGKLQQYSITGSGQIFGAGAGILPPNVQQAAKRVHNDNRTQQAALRQSALDRTAKMNEQQRAAQIKLTRQMAKLPTLRRKNENEPPTTPPAIAPPPDDLAKRALQQLLRPPTTSTAPPTTISQVSPPAPKGRTKTVSEPNYDTHPLYEEGKRLYYQRNFTQARAHFQKLAGVKGNKHLGAYGLGVIDYANGDLESAESQFKKCLSINKDYADAIYYLGQIALHRRSIPDSIDFYRQALKKNPKHLRATSQLDSLERYTLEYAKALYRLRRFSESKKAFTALTQSERYRSAGFYGLGVIEFQGGNSNAARTHFERCVELHPNHANAYFYFAWIARLRSKTAESQKLYQRVLEINPKHVGALVHLKDLGRERSGGQPKRKSTSEMIRWSKPAASRRKSGSRKVHRKN